MRFPSIYDMFRPSLEAGMMLAEAQLVIGMRMAGMAGLWPMPPEENFRMVAEKIAASQASVQAALLAGMRGATAGQVATAAIAPYRKQTKANARRLSGK